MERRTFLNMGVAGLGTLAVAGPAAAQFVAMPSKEKWAVIFGTWYGTARDAAVWVSEGMGGSPPCSTPGRRRRTSGASTTS